VGGVISTSGLQGVEGSQLNESATFVPASYGPSILWGNYTGNTIELLSLDFRNCCWGGFLSTSPVIPDHPDGLAIDSATGRLYWANAGANTISFASLGAGPGGTLRAPGATFSAPGGVAVDPATGKIYWANSNSIGYAELNGSGGGRFDTKGAVVDQPNDVAVDPANGRLYWANSGNNTIYSAKLNDTGAGQKLNTGRAIIADPNGLAIDVSTGKLYWANGNNNTNPIGWAKTNNSGAANLPTPGAMANGAFGLALDHAAGILYWGNYNNNYLSGALLNGTGGQLIVPGTGPGYPILLKAPLATAAPQISGGTTVDSKLSCTKGKWAPDQIGAFLYQQPTSFSYSWSRNGTPIARATRNSITATHTGTYACTVTAKNYGGSTQKASTAHNVTT
jgi:DNA-binding beta-propeller fold protein YncE